VSRVRAIAGEYGQTFGAPGRIPVSMGCVACGHSDPSGVGSLSDSTVIAEDYIIRMAEQQSTSQAVVLGHLDHLPVTHVYGQLRDLIRARSLRTVTLNDVFLPGR
jgi:hypothetical protein